MSNKAENLSKEHIENYLPEMCRRYSLCGVKPIGEHSGFGAVWLAKDNWLNREVAIKISDTDLSDEISLCRDIEGHTVRIFDYFRGKNDWNAYAMELLQSPWITLSTYIKKRRYKPNDIQHYFDCFEIIRHILLGLRDIHGQSYKRQNRYVHADLKPANLFLLCKPKKRVNSVFRMPECEQVIKIIDLGIALERGNLNCYGTPGYCYPIPVEACSGHDLYSLGIVFLQMLGGNLPRQDVMKHKARIKQAVISTSSGSVYIDNIAVEFINKCARAPTHPATSASKLIDFLDDNLFGLDAAKLLALRAINKEKQKGLKKDELALFLFDYLDMYCGWTNKTQGRLDGLKNFITDMYEQDMLELKGRSYFVR
jgi:serine/threonine protein kinase